MSAATVVKRVWAREVADGRALACGHYMELRYTTADPYAVTLAELGPGGGELAFARDLLKAALRDGVAGEGAVRVWLRCQGIEDIVLLLAAALPSCTVEFGLSTRAVAWLLAEAFRLVPAGAESEFTDVDGELAEVLGAA